MKPPLQRSMAGTACWNGYNLRMALIWTEAEDLLHLNWCPKLCLLGYDTTEHGGIAADAMGKSTVSGLFVAGDAAYVGPSQLIYAAASGSKAAMAVLMDLTEEDFSWQ